MKKVITLSLLCFYVFSFAQNDSLIRDIITARSLQSDREVQVDLEKEHILRQEKVSRVIKERNIPYSYVSDLGVYSEIVDVYPDGRPLYYQGFNSRAAQIAKVPAIQKGGKFNLNLTGKNVLIGVFDATPVYKKHDEFKDRLNQIHIKSEVVSESAPLSERRNFQIAQEHATHVTGTILAKGLYPEAKGLAPGVRLYSYNWRNDEINMRDAAKKGALASNHSYGAVIISNGRLIIDQRLVGVYDWKAEGFDRVTFAFKNYLPVIAAGNNHKYANILNDNQTEFNNLAGIATAKNTLVVGSLAQLSNSLDITDMTISPTSNYGPTRDFRIKPDIVAKGEGLYSTINDYSRTEDYILRTDRYTYLAGTSMASPVVTSLVALLQEWAVNAFNTPLRAASIKGLIIHTAYSLNKITDKESNTVKDLGKGPNAVYGWGAIDAEKAMTLLNNLSTNRSYLIENELINKKTKKYIITNNYDNNEIEATLVWTDPASVFDYSIIAMSNSKPVLVNDLDMRLKTSDLTYLPWALNKDISNPIALEKDNDVDNVERITSKKLPKGESILTISHKGGIILGRQEYSLILSSKEPISIVEINTSKSGDIATEEIVILPKEITDLDIGIWPNPVVNIANLDYDIQQLKVHELKIYDLNGRLIKVVNDVDKKALSLEDLTIGRYILNFMTSEGIIVKHIVKK
ncbi:S8 family serine peptidase [Myroides marinus]|uniref:S8 family serine peptidase n=1 Tax=Myroides marinus TaxID=703342 RepID=UPI002578277D|nr:S8 family serine peptidase [Myroides marinus]MDM1533246.1 S8 family serine peptidase [Myroides marinus]MDM1540197.1 S8 family serine peptidase [Myroides marinus]